MNLVSNNKNINEDHNDCDFNFFQCTNQTNCYCINCVIPQQNWINMSINICDDATKSDEILYDHDETINIVLHNDKEDNKEYNKEDDKKDYINYEKIFNNTFICDKNYDQAEFINNLEKNLINLDCDLIYKNDEIIIYNIIDAECYLSNLIVFVDEQKKITKIKIISNPRSEFIKSNIYKKIILFK